jgi:hypothetical protein
MSVAIVDESQRPLAPADVLAVVDLYGPGERGPGERIRYTGVQCGRPLLYPIPVDDLPPVLRARADAYGRRYFGAIFAFDLEELPPRRQYVAVSFDVALADPQCLAVHLHEDADALGFVYGAEGLMPASAVAVHAARATGERRRGWLSRLLSSDTRPRARAVGTMANEFGWRYADRRGLPLARTYAMHALVEVPPGRSELRGALAARVDLNPSRGGDPPVLASVGDVVSFAEPLDAGAGESRRSGVRLCVAADIEGYGRRDNQEANALQGALVDVLAGARRHAGIPEHAVDVQPQGDAELALLPAGIDESVVIPALVDHIGDALDEYNRRSGRARMRLRVALHRGFVSPGPSGWAGNASVAVFRILNCPPLREALARHADVDFVLGVPDVLYQDVIAHGYGDLDPSRFADLTVDVPDKHYRERVWLLVPDASA